MLYGVKMLNEGHDTALVVKDVAYLLLSSLVDEDDLHACIEECLLTQTVKKGMIFENNLVEHLSVGHKADVKTVFLGFTEGAEGLCLLTA